MSDIIIKAVEAEFRGAWLPTLKDRKIMRNLSHDQQVAAAADIARQARQIYEILVAQTGLPHETIPYAWVMDLLDLQTPGRRFTVKDNPLGRITRAQLVEVTRMQVLFEADWLTGLYLKHKGEMPDAEGLAWWKAEWEEQFVKGIKPALSTDKTGDANV